MTRVGALLVFVSAAFAFVGTTIGLVGGQETQPIAAGVYTAAQAQAGQTAYRQNCAGCHLADFRGSGDAPAVAGPDFTAKWGPRAVNELFTYLVQAMPPANPGSLGEAGTLEVTAYLLQVNGAPVGRQPLTATVSTPINALLTGQPRAQSPASTAAGRAGGRSGMPPVLGAGTAAGPGRGGAAANRGVTVRGEVRNYVPVTSDMLKSPPRGDWLMFRGNYHGQSYSPLNQITPANVKNLQLQWVWSMNDSGANQTTPLVHNGVIYLASPSNFVPALDGKTGELIWETRVGPDQAPGYGGIRTIAMAEDKIFLPASNAHMVALSARNGEILWDTPAAPDGSCVNTSGAIVIGDKVLQGLTGCGRFDGLGCYISAYDTL